MKRMKKYVITLLAVPGILICKLYVQQPSAAELEKMIKQAQKQMKKYGNDTTLNKMMMNLQDQQKQVSETKKYYLPT